MVCFWSASTTVYVVPVAFEILLQASPLSLQRSHWYVNLSAPVHEPLCPVSTVPTLIGYTYVIDGSFVLVGAAWLRPTAVDVTSSAAAVHATRSTVPTASLRVRLRITPPPHTGLERVFMRSRAAASPRVDERDERAP